MIQIGSKIRHVKRCSDYLVIAKARTAERFEDQDEATLFLKPGTIFVWGIGRVTEKAEFTLALPVCIQVSALSVVPPITAMWVYQGEYGIYARPQAEFTPDRFELLPPF